MPIEMVLEGMDKKYEYKEIEIGGKASYRTHWSKSGKIVQLSVNPQDF